MPRIPACGGFRMGVKPSTPNIPREVTVNVPPATSSIPSWPSRARAASPAEASASWRRLFSCASLITGTIRPSSSATATPRCTGSKRVIALSMSAAFMAGCWGSALATARSTRSVMVTRRPSRSHSPIRASRSRTASSMPASMSMVSWAESRRLACMRSAMVLRMPASGTASPGGLGCVCGVVGGGDLAACCTSSRVTRPRGPVPATLARSTFSSAASLRAAGDAAIRLPLAAGALAGTGAPSACRTAMSGFGVGFGSTSGITSPSP